MKAEQLEILLGIELEESKMMDLMDLKDDVIEYFIENGVEKTFNDIKFMIEKGKVSKKEALKLISRVSKEDDREKRKDLRDLTLDSNFLRFLCPRYKIKLMNRISKEDDREKREDLKLMATLYSLICWKSIRGQIKLMDKVASIDDKENREHLMCSTVLNFDLVGEVTTYTLLKLMEGEILKQKEQAEKPISVQKKEELREMLKSLKSQGLERFSSYDNLRKKSKIKTNIRFKN